jgi:glycosyltransferase involved in cell wall biosynthesis
MLGGARMRTLVIGGLPHNPDGSGYYRFFLPFKHLIANSRHLIAVGPHGPQAAPLSPADIPNMDVLAMQRPAGRNGVYQLERLVGHVKLVYETDDDLLQAEPSGLPHLFDTQTLEGIRRSLRLVDAVTVSTPYLAEQMRPYNPNVFVLPNYVKAGLLDLHRPKRETLTVGWAAGSSHLIDIVTVSDQLRAVLEANPQVDMHFMGHDWSPELHRADLASAVKRQCRWSNWQPDVGEYYKQIDFDIAIAPLADVPFNRSKSHIRALEMAACGIPIVAADLLPYHDFVKDGKTGFLYSTPTEFAKRLDELIHDADARAELGANAKEQARGWTIEEHWVKWQDAYEEVAERGTQDRGSDPAAGVRR